MAIVYWLVVGIPTPLKNDGVKVSWDDDIPNIWKKTCSKPPSRWLLAIGYISLVGLRNGSQTWISSPKKTGGSYQNCWYLSKFIHITMAPNVWSKPSPRSQRNDWIQLAIWGLKERDSMDPTNNGEFHQRWGFKQRDRTQPKNIQKLWITLQGMTSDPLVIHLSNENSMLFWWFLWNIVIFRPTMWGFPRVKCNQLMSGTTSISSASHNYLVTFQYQPLFVIKPVTCGLNPIQLRGSSYLTHLWLTFQPSRWP